MFFFFLKTCWTTRVTSSSQPGRILGSASRMVTSEPRSASVDANSQPIAPPPITTERRGTRGISKNSSEVTTGPPASNPGIVRGTDPLARITASAVSVTCWG